MWLLDTTTLELREFQSTPPPYAILSHTWGEEEVTFQELRGISFQQIGSPEVKRKAGYQKIIQCCAKAKSDDLAYAWVDTCCIDKRSSAELSEAINSMYRWYAEAQLCYAFLSDVSTLGSNGDLSNMQIQPFPRTVWGFPSSRWFTRGWCLQELIAPMHVVFFDKDWLEIGTKASLLDDLLEITGIPCRALMQPLSIWGNSVAERMSWASTRETSRVEDLAYSLLGIFGVNMPLLYGEGRKAFQRLQMQILSDTGDHSIFAWTTPMAQNVHKSQPFGILAESPAMFSVDVAGPVDRFLRSDFSMNEITMTNLGVSINLPVVEYPEGTVAILDCMRQGQRDGIYVSGSVDASQRARIRPQHLFYASDKVMRTTRSQNVYFRTNIESVPPDNGHMQIDLSLRVHSEQLDTIYWCKSWRSAEEANLPTNYHRRLWGWTKHGRSLRTSPLTYKQLPPVKEGQWLAVSFKRLDGGAFSLVFGPKDGRVWCHAIVGFEVLQLDHLGAPSAIREMLHVGAPASSAIHKMLASKLRVDDEAWHYFRDRASYKLDDSYMMHVAIKLVTSSASRRYRVEVLQEQIVDTETNLG